MPSMRPRKVLSFPKRVVAPVRGTEAETNGVHLFGANSSAFYAASCRSYSFAATALGRLVDDEPLCFFTPKVVIST